MTMTTCNKRRMATTATALSMLPEEMETEVLLRLPVKSILRFSAVCRRWAALLSSEEFDAGRTNLLAESSTTEPAAQLLFFPLAPSCLGTLKSSTEVRRGDGVPLLKLDLNLNFDGVRRSSAGCCGLILLHDPASHCYHILNAATRAVAMVPLPRHNGDLFPSSAGGRPRVRCQDQQVQGGAAVLHQHAAAGLVH